MREALRPLLLGHRGARAVRSIPENTLESFDRALADGCDGFEFDVRLTRDGEPVVYHNPKVGTVDIATATYSQLNQLPRLEDVLSRYCDRAFLDIELKVSGLEKITLEMLRKYAPRKGFVISSFLPQVLVAIRENNEHVPLGLICETRDEFLRWKELPVEYVILHYKLVTASRMRALKDTHKRIFVWTVNRPEAMTRFRDLGADGIISDDAALLCRTLSGT